MGLVADPLADQADEVRGAAGELEADQVGAEQALEDLAAPRQLLEELGRRERDVQVEADPQVGAQVAQHLRHQLELVVLHPDRGALGGHLGGLLGEALVDRRRRRPTTRGGTPAWRPRRGRAATGCRWRSPRRTPRSPRRSGATGTSVHAVLARRARGPRPAPPGQPIQAPSLRAHHRLEGGHQPAGGAPPAERCRRGRPRGPRAAGWRRSRGRREPGVVTPLTLASRAAPTVAAADGARTAPAAPRPATTRRGRMTSLWFVAYDGPAPQS